MLLSPAKSRNGRRRRVTVSWGCAAHTPNNKMLSSNDDASDESTPRLRRRKIPSRGEGKELILSLYMFDAAVKAAALAAPYTVDVGAKTQKRRKAACPSAPTCSASRRRSTFAVRSFLPLCNCEVLTTGFDAPKVTHVIMARPIVSQVLYKQMIGRGPSADPASAAPRAASSSTLRINAALHDLNSATNSSGISGKVAAETSNEPADPFGKLSSAYSLT